jgi:hypothetical protein
MNDFYTYAYLREDRTPYYVGKGKNKRAYKRCKTDIKPPKHKTRILILKNNLTEEEAFKHERYMIGVFGRKDLGTGILRNRTDGGDGASGAIRSDEWRRKQSEMRKGKTRSEEHNRKMSEALKGRTHSEEHKRKISKALKGRTHSEEHKRKISEVKKNKTHSEETKRKMSEMRKGRTHSEEHRRKNSEAKRGKKWWNDGCGNCKMSIECPGDNWVLGMK